MQPPSRWSRRASRRRRIAQELSSRITWPRARVIFRIYGWMGGQIRTRAYELVLRRVTYRDAYTLCVHRFSDGTALNNVTYPLTNARHLQILHHDLCNAAWKQPIDRPVFSRGNSSDATRRPNLTHIARHLSEERMTARRVFPVAFAIVRETTLDDNRQQYHRPHT